MSSIRLQKVNALAPGGVVENASIDIADGVIADVAPGLDSPVDKTIDCSGLTAWPGFIDVHIHGAVGVDVNVADSDGLVEVARFLARHGVTAWMPTLVPDSDENYHRAIAAVDRLMEVQGGLPIAQAVGVHYEGVFANEQMCGALRPQFFKTYTGTELSQLPKLRSGAHMTTFAPEVDGGVELAAALSESGWIASIGHTRADIETLDKAFNAGARHVTHFFNAMTPMHHRDVGVVGWALANREVTFDIIADGIHVQPSMLDVACHCKSPEKVTLISDSVAPTGLGDGSFTVWDENITVDGGRTRNERGSIAGSVITMLDAVRRMRSLEFNDSEVSLMASRNPARLIGIEADHGSIAIGRRADMAILDDEGNTRLVLIGGETAFSDL
ncbi:MAG TPA: N-acetylglucosamine-6-phosphate deacetylase [Pyrinomonadaceae bacterium]|nr:N-acetylglucosamine-6-phosphate deacetylase [Pyrinomonadaceae bacterium]